MNRKEHLLVVLLEELAETQKAVTKALRFGLENGKPNSSTNNADDIETEFAHAIAAMEILERDGFLKRDGSKLMRQLPPPKGGGL